MSPGIMFLDEPTTGLDSTNAAKVVDILSKLGFRHGVTVLLSIHQPRPDIFRLLDRILILSSVGSVVYSGPSISAKGFFESLAYAPPRPLQTHNVADFILDVVIKSSREKTSRACRDFAVSDIFMLNERTIEMLVIEASSDETEENCDDDDDEEQGNRRKVRGKSTRSLAKKRSAPMKVQIQQLPARLCKNATRHPFLITTHFIATLFFRHCTRARYSSSVVETLAKRRIGRGVVSSFSYFSRSCHSPPSRCGERTIYCLGEKFSPARTVWTVISSVKSRSM